MKKYIDHILILFFVIILTGCGSVNHKINLEDGFSPKIGTNIEIDKTINATGQEFDIDIEKFFSDALAEALREKNMLWTGENTPKLKLQGKIIEYEEGNAFKRWLLPGWGATVVSVQCDLRDGQQIVGTIDARRTVSMGGGYTINAWRTIFADIAEDIVEELETKIMKN